MNFKIFDLLKNGLIDAQRDLTLFLFNPITISQKLKKLQKYNGNCSYSKTIYKIAAV